MNRLDELTDPNWRAVPNEPDEIGPIRIGPTDPRILEMVRAELGIDGAEAAETALAVAERIRYLERTRIAGRMVADRTAIRDQRLDLAHVVTAGAFIQEPEPITRELLGRLALEGHNITLTAQYKTGKTTFVGNAAGALASGGPFLGRFETRRPRRVALFNYELHTDDQRSFTRTLNLPAEALENLLVVNLRGVRLSLTTPAGRDWVVSVLRDYGAEVWIVDTYGAAVAPSIDSENDNAAARRFLATVDEIKALSGCPTSLWTAHTGRKTHDEGTEHARGATVLDDWTDIRLILTRDRAGVRYLASEGRSDYELPESALRYDQATRGLWLADSDVGTSRSEARAAVAAESVSKVVVDSPGLTTTELRNMLDELGLTQSQAKQAAIMKARTRGLVHIHRDGRKTLHYSGPLHAEGEPCSA